MVVDRHVGPLLPRGGSEVPRASRPQRLVRGSNASLPREAMIFGLLGKQSDAADACKPKLMGLGTIGLNRCAGL